MSLTITASLFDPLGKPLAGLDAQVCLFTLAGDAKPIVAGRVDDYGNLKLVSRWLAPADYQPRLQLQLQRGGVFVEASENPGQFVDGVCDFGRVVFNPNLDVKLLEKDAALLGDVVGAVGVVSDGNEAEALMARVSVLESERDLLIKTLTQQAAATLAAKTAELNAQRVAEKEALTVQLTQQAAATLAAKTAELNAQRLAEKEALTVQLTQQAAATLAAKTAELNAQRVAEKDALTQQAAATLAAKTAELNAQRVAEKDALTQQAAATLAAKTAELNAQRVAEKDALAKQHAQALAAKDQQLGALSEQLAAANRDSAPETTIEAVARSTAEQLDRVRQTLQTGQSGLRLGKVALQLKVLPGTTGGTVALPQSKQIERVGAQALGSLDLAFLPETATPASRPQLLAPSVLGHTESFARRKLAERRLAAEVVYRLVTRESEHGRVVFQRPAPEAPVAEGTVVLIAIGRQAEHDPRPT